MKDGGPAFPYSYEEKDPNYPPETISLPGMMLRDYFAAQAISGLAMISPAEKVAGFAYALADAMLAARCPQVREEPHD